MTLGVISRNGPIVAVLAFALVASEIAHGQSPDQGRAWPSRPVRLVLPFAPGGAPDVVMRIVMAKVGEQTSATYVVDNRTGANGNIGTERVKAATPDGYTFLVGTPGPLAINPHLFSSLPYDAIKDFTPVVHVVGFPQMLAVSSSVSARTVAELIALAKSQPNKLNYGSSGSGSTGGLISVSFLRQAGIAVAHVPFRGGALAIQALLAGEVQFVIDGLPSFTAHLQSGRLRALAVTTADRWPGLPNIPTIAESVPGFDFAGWVLLAAPAGTSTAIIARLASEVDRALRDDQIAARLKQVGAMPVGGNAETALRFHRAEFSKWKRVVEASGAKAEQQQ